MPIAPSLATPSPAAVPAEAAPAPTTSRLPLTDAGTTQAAADDTLAIDAYIDSDRCTSCNECINLNRKMFAYNADKQAYVKDAKAGTFAQLVMAAEKCPVSAIHPGTPLNPKEKDLDKWLKRAQAF